MRPAFVISLAVIMIASLAVAQVGPKQTEEVKKKKKAEEKAEKPSEPQAKPAERSVKAVKMIEKTKSDTLRVSTALKRFLFTTAIENREPKNDIDSLSTDSTKVYFFTEIVGLKGHTVKHRWIRGGKVIAEVPIAIGGPRWRAYSSKKLLPEWTGEWKVEVVDEDGSILGAKILVYHRSE